MSSQYRFFLREPDGTPLAWIPPTAWVYFGYTRRVNDVGRFEGSINMTKYSYLEPFFNVEAGGHLDAILEVWRSVDLTPPDFYLEQQFLVRYSRKELLNDGRERLTIIARTLEFFLESCIIFPDDVNPPALPTEGDEASDYYAPSPGAFPWPLPNTPNFTGVPLVAANSDTTEKMTAVMDWCQITNPDALLNVTIPAAPGGGIPEHHIGERYGNLLEVLQDLSAASWWASFGGLSGTPINNGVDWRLTPNLTSPYLPWTFEIRVGGWGVDHRASSTRPIVFSPTKNNMTQPVILVDRLEEKTRVLVGGDGTDQARDILSVVDNARIADSIYNLRDEFIDSRKIDPFAAVPPPDGIDQATEQGQRRLKERGIRRDFSFILTDNKNTQYGIDFGLGDLISAEFSGALQEFQIREIEVNQNNNQEEQITVRLGPLDGSAWRSSDIWEQLVSRIRDLAKQNTEDAAGT